MRGHTRPKSSEKNGKFGDQLGWEKAQGWSREACKLGYVSILAKSWDFVLEMGTGIGATPDPAPATDSGAG